MSLHPNRDPQDFLDKWVDRTPPVSLACENGDHGECGHPETCKCGCDHVDYEGRD